MATGSKAERGGHRRRRGKVKREMGGGRRERTLENKNKIRVFL